MNLMYPRLFLARNLLKEDGVIFISIGNEEVDNLKKICSEVFGEENFRNSIIIRRGVKNLQAQFDTIDSLNSGYEFVLMYSKSNDTRFEKIFKETDEEPIGNWNNHWRGTDRPTMRYEIFGIKPEKGQWRWAKERSLQAIVNYENMLKDIKIESPSQEDIDKWYLDKCSKDRIDLLRLSRNGKPEHYIPPSNKRLLNDLWEDIKPNGSTYTTQLFNEKIFDNPKSLDLLKRILEFSVLENDIILDFFSGSATTAHAVMDLNAQDGGNRKFIMVQLPEPTDESSEAFKAGYKNICEIGKERIRRAGKKIKEQLTVDSGQLKLGEEEKENRKLDTGFRVFRLDKSNFNIWQGENVENLQQALFSHVEHIDKTSTEEDILFELILKAGYSINDKVTGHIIEGKKVYSLFEDAVLISLEKNLTKDFIKTIAHMEPAKVILLDEGFNNNDALKTNAVEIMKSKKIEDFRTV